MTSLKNQREVLKAQRGSQKKKTITSVAAVIGVVVVALLLLYFIPRRQVDGPSVGDPNAPVKVEQFSNFTCSYCRSFALESEPDFIKEYVNWGASPRAAQYLMLAGKARALLHGRFNVSVEDVQSLVFPVLRHRILTNFHAESQRITTEEIIKRLLEAVPVPRSGLAR